MNDVAEDDYWSRLEKMERRKAEDQRLIQEWARTNGSRDVKHLRKFVEQVRRDIGANGVIIEVNVKPSRDGLEVGAGYYMESGPAKDQPGTGQPTGVPLDQLGVIGAQTGNQVASGGCYQGQGSLSTPMGGGSETLSDMVSSGAAATDSTLPGRQGGTEREWVNQPQSAYVSAEVTESGVQYRQQG